MSPNKVFERRFPAGRGLEKLLEATRNPAPPAPIAPPPDTLEALKASGGDGLVLTSFTAEDALELGHLIHARLRPFASAAASAGGGSAPRPAVVHVCLAGGAQTAYHSVTGPGTAPDNEEWVRRKRASALRFGGSTWGLGRKFGGDEGAFAAKYALGPEAAGRYAIHGGGVPVRVRGVEGVVGVVVVSGLAQQEDHGVVMEVVRENWHEVE